MRPPLRTPGPCGRVPAGPSALGPLALTSTPSPWLRPASPPPSADGQDGTGPKHGHGPRSGGVVVTCRARVFSWPEQQRGEDQQNLALKEGER